jgi:sarcosine oxidase subunit beta
MNVAHIIIIGGGVIGTSIAFQLAKQGCHDVVVLEKNYVGSGCTEKCAGGIRQQFSLEANIRLSMESVQFFTRFESETGHTADFRQHGYLMLATTEHELETFRKNVELERKLGLEVDLLSPRETKELVPQLEVRDVLGATFCRSDGYADPYSVVTGFASAARRLGVKILEGVEVTGIDLEGDRIKGVLTTAGRFTAPVVVNAAGAYAGAVGKMVGLDVPVHPTRRHIFITEPIPGSMSLSSDFRLTDLPMVVDFSNGFWFRQEGHCILFGMRNPDEPESYCTSVDWDFFARVVAPAACHRLPGLADIGIMRAQAGLHPDTADEIAILGRVPSIDKLYLACGFGGHGFMHSPAIGRLMAELILEKISALPDAGLFDLNRFHSQLEHKENLPI